MNIQNRKILEKQSRSDKSSGTGHDTDTKGTSSSDKNVLETIKLFSFVFITLDFFYFKYSRKFHTAAFHCAPSIVLQVKYSWKCLKSRTKYLEQSKEIKQNWTRRENFNNCFSIIFTAIAKVWFLKGGWALGSISTQISFFFLMFPNLLRSKV